MDTDQLLDIFTTHVMDEMKNRGTTSTSELDAYCSRKFKPGFFVGVFPADKEPPVSKKRDFYIQNTMPSDHPGEHWVGIAREPGYPDLLFDSFARKPSSVFMPHLIGKVESTEDDVDQFPRDSSHCGQLVCAFGLIFERFGRRVAKMC
jgi:hypothetical protein